MVVTSEAYRVHNTRPTCGLWKARMRPTASRPKCVNFGTKVAFVLRWFLLDFSVFKCKVWYVNKNLWLCSPDHWPGALPLDPTRGTAPKPPLWPSTLVPHLFVAIAFKYVMHRYNSRCGYGIFFKKQLFMSGVRWWMKTGGGGAGHRLRCLCFLGVVKLLVGW